jgi:hypothetical protein
MTKTIGIALFVAILSGTLYADVDCSKLATWVDGHTYHQGDVVWFNPHNGGQGAEYRCKDSTCTSNPVNNGWERAAECQIGTNK